MSNKPISPLRQRMIEDMSVRNFNEKTRNDYIRQVRTFTAFLRRSPDTATAEDLRRYQLHQTQAGVRPSGINAAVSALRFFFTVTLDRPEMARRLTVVREPRRIPAILSPDEVARLLDAVPHPKHKAALSVAYGAGLRVSEVVALKVSDIDPKRMLLRVEQGKGRKDRLAMLSPQLLELLRHWYRISRPRIWLFPGQDPTNHLTARQFNRIGSCSSPHRQDQKAGDATHIAAFLRHSSARTEGRYSCDPDPLGSRPARHHSALYPRCFHDHSFRHQSTRPPHLTVPQEGPAAGIAHRPCAPPRSRGCGYLPRPWRRLASCQRRSYQPWPTEGDEGH